MTSLWNSASPSDWRAALDSYPQVIARQDVTRLAELDSWYREELPGRISGRIQPHVILDELVRLTEWKMARGEWRARNLVLVKGNDPDAVIDVSSAALSAVPHPTAPITAMVKLAGVGPATASAVAAAFAPETYPFFDELVAAQVPGPGEIKWTLGYYARYADALRERASTLAGAWSPVMVERALWANAGGKKGA